MKPLLYALFLASFLVACTTEPEETTGNNDEITDPADPADTGDTPVAGDTSATDVTWFSNATSFRGQDDRRITYVCPPEGTASVVWGTDVYTDDSSVCMAAVHAGKITYEAGGTVVIEIRPGESSYEASTRNSVTTFSYGTWSGSFVFP